MATRLEARGLTVELPTRAGWVRPVNEVSFTLGEGETLGIVGESGSGKTMLALALMGLEPPGARLKGEAWLRARAANGNGSSMAKPAAQPAAIESAGDNLLTAAREKMYTLRGGDIAMIFQEPMTALNPVIRIGAQIDEAIRAHEPRSRSRRSPPPRARKRSNAPPCPSRPCARASIRTSFRAACASAP